MRREPSLHIGKSSLNHLIEEWFNIHKIGIPGDDLVEYLLKKGVNYTLTHRKKLDNYNGHTKKKTDRLKLSSVEAGRTFAGILTQARQQRRHRGISKIREAGKDWELAKECAGKVVSFSESYKLPFREGCIIYVNLFLDLLANNKNQFSLQHLPRKHDLICNTYEAQLEINEDTLPEETKKAHDIYCLNISERTGITTDYTKEPLKYIFFVYACKLANKLGLSTKDYIVAQFESLNWTKGIPAPAQMVTKNAEERAIHWMVENNIKSSRGKLNPNTMSKEQMGEFWAKFKSKLKHLNEVNSNQ